MLFPYEKLNKFVSMLSTKRRIRVSECIASFQVFLHNVDKTYRLHHKMHLAEVPSRARSMLSFFLEREQKEALPHGLCLMKIQGWHNMCCSFADELQLVFP